MRLARLPPLAGEQVHLVSLAQWHRHLVNIVGGPPDTALAVDALDRFLKSLRRRDRARHIVLRAPILARHMKDFLDLAEASRFRFDCVILVRDPRDILCSMKTWNERNIAERGKPLAEDIVAFTSQIIRQSYAYLPPQACTVRYEDMVADTGVFCDELSRRLDIERDGLGVAWENRRVELARDDPRLGVCITDLYLQPASNASVRRWRDELPERERLAIEGATQTIMRRFGYEMTHLAISLVISFRNSTPPGLISPSKGERLLPPS